MENQKDPRLTNEDDLHAENNLLKVKLQLEHNMQMEETSTLKPSIENQWLKSVYAFEQQFRDCKRVSLYDFIGRPPFTKCDMLAPSRISEELARLLAVMEQNAVQLDRICEYDDALIYRFITEELFDHEMDDIRIPGMTCHFTYEEFHPNHDHDLRRVCDDFIVAAFTREWIEEIDDRYLAENVLFSGRDFSRKGISAVIRTFQEVHTRLHVEAFEIGHVVIDPTLTTAVVDATLWVTGEMNTNEKVVYQGMCSFEFVMERDYWYITSFSIPGL